MSTETDGVQEKLQKIKGFFTDEESRVLIDRAFEFAYEAHKDQKRESGEPYIMHPLASALTLAQMHLDAATVAAALLHDVMDNNSVTKEEVEKAFGLEISFLVDGVTKLGKLKYRGVERHAENLRKMLVAMAQDIRVILIKFADRLHNMETLDALEERKRYRIALETLEIYAPIAIRLGMAELAKQLEDLAFSHVNPDKHKYITTEMTIRFPEVEKYLARLRPIVEKELQDEGVKPHDIEMRSKHAYSLWRKLEKYNYNWGEVHDLVAMRIIVDSVDECYKTLGILHKLWRPLPGRIKDFIALPKPNGYQSLHTTVFSLDGRRTEFQIRTRQMHENAEYGIAAHWRYKDKTPLTQRQANRTYAWVNQIREWQNDSSHSADFIDNLKLDIFGDRIFVFTPHGDVIDLPQGATPVDFAYSIHSDLGSRCAAALINGKMKQLNVGLQNGDVVEILKSKNKTPSRQWLSFVKTSVARGHIKHWLREQSREENITVGMALINEELRALLGKTWSKLASSEQQVILQNCSSKTEQDLFAAIGGGDISARRVARALLELPQEEVLKEKVPQGKKYEYKISVAGISGLQTRMAHCCHPTPPEQIVAYVTAGRGASIHTVDCTNLSRVSASKKIIPAYWRDTKNVRNIRLKLRTMDRIGMIQDISHAIASLNANIITLNVDTQKNTTKSGEAIIIADVEIPNLTTMRHLYDKLKSIEGVAEARRIQISPRNA